MTTKTTPTDGLTVDENGRVVLPTRRPQIRRLRVSTLRPHPTLQRPLDENRIIKMALEFQPALLGMLLISEQSDGEFFILDGMHRHGTLLLAEWQDKDVACEVYDDLTPEQEALLFRGRNNTKRLHPLDLHKAAVVQREATAVACDALARRYRLVIRRGAPNGLTAISALRRIYETNPEAAETMLSVSTRAWGPVKEAVEAPIIEGLGRLFNRYGTDPTDGGVDLERLVKKLAKVGVPGTLVGRARTYAEIHSMRIGPSLAAVIVELYNRGPGRTLPTWDAREPRDTTT